MNSQVDSPYIDDDWLSGTHGRLFMRTWTPSGSSHLSPIVLIHDSLGSVELWRNFPMLLSQATGRKIVAYDRLGFGKSDAHPSRLKTDFVGSEARNDFSAVIEHLGIDHFVVFGHSVGGGMAVHIAAHFPNACHALITESAQAFVEDRTIAGIEQAREQFKDVAQVDRLAKYHGDKARWVLDAWIGSWLHPDFSDWSLDSVLPEVKAPALVIHGENDEYGSTKHPEMIAGRSGDVAQFVVMEDTKHVPHRERESDVIGLVKGFLASLP